MVDGSADGNAAQRALGDVVVDSRPAIAGMAHQRLPGSLVQRYREIGDNRAARLIERMEAEGVVSQANQAGKREVLAPPGR
jgi:DNA segregation ATPase FtsK/SpoIIIE, S-DNA-T family